MDLTSGVVMTLGDKKYIILDTIMHENDRYALTNEVKSEEDLTEDYYIFKIIDEEVKIMRNEELINTLLPKFQEKLKDTIAEQL